MEVTQTYFLLRESHTLEAVGMKPSLNRIKQIHILTKHLAERDLSAGGSA